MSASTEHPTNVTRTIETDLTPEELWALVADGGSWPEWMVDDADVAVEPGGGGTVVDDGTARTVRIDSVDADMPADDAAGRRLGFTWWPDDRPDLASAVELVVLPAPDGSRLLVTESLPVARAVAQVSTWDVRLVLLAAWAAVARAMSPV